MLTVARMLFSLSCNMCCSMLEATRCVDNNYAVWGLGSPRGDYIGDYLGFRV